MTRDEMFSKVIQRFGFESKKTIRFATHMETDTDEALRSLFRSIMK